MSDILKNQAQIEIQGQDTIKTNENQVGVNPTIKVTKKAIECAQNGHIKDNMGDKEVVGDKIFYELVLSNQHSKDLTEVNIADYLNIPSNGGVNNTDNCGITLVTLFDLTKSANSTHNGGTDDPKANPSIQPLENYTIAWTDNNEDKKVYTNSDDNESKITIGYKKEQDINLTIPANHALSITYWITPSDDVYTAKTPLKDTAHVTYTENPAGSNTVEPSNEIALIVKKPVTPASGAIKKAYSDSSCTKEIEEVLCGQKFWYKISYKNTTGEAQNITKIADELTDLTYDSRDDDKVIVNDIDASNVTSKLTKGSNYDINYKSSNVTINFQNVGPTTAQPTGYELAADHTIEVIIPVTHDCHGC